MTNTGGEMIEFLRKTPEARKIVWEMCNCSVFCSEKCAFLDGITRDLD